MMRMLAITTILSAQAAPLPPQERIPARVRAAREITLSAEVGGRVVGRPVKRGAMVKKGDPVLVIDPTFHKLAVRAAEAGVGMAEADARFARAELARTRRMATTDSVAAANIEEAEARAARADAAALRARVALDEAKERLARTVIRAPENGALSEVHPEVGEWVAPGTPVAEVLTVNDLVIETFVPPSQVARFREGATVAVSLPAPLGGRTAGKVREVAPAAGARRTFRVVVALPDPPAGLRAGFDAFLEVPAAR